LRIKAEHHSQARGKHSPAPAIASSYLEQPLMLPKWLRKSCDKGHTPLPDRQFFKTHQRLAFSLHFRTFSGMESAISASATGGACV